MKKISFGDIATGLWYAIYPIIIYEALSYVYQFMLLIYDTLRGEIDIFADNFEDIINSYALPYLGISAFLIIPFIMIFIIGDNRREGFSRKEFVKKINIFDFIITCFLAISSCITFNILIGLLGIPQDDAAFESVANAMQEAGIFLQILVAGMLAPILEELVFRGVFYRRLRYKFGNVFAVIVSSVVFGIVHANLTQGIYATILGFILAILYTKRESLMLCILFHMAANIMSVLIAIPSVSEWMEEFPAFSVLLILLSFIVFIVLFIYIIIRDYRIKYDRGYQV